MLNIKRKLVNNNSVLNCLSFKINDFYNKINQIR